MNLLDLLVKIGVQDEASGAVNDISGNIVGKLGRAAKTAAKALAGAFAVKKVVEFGKASVGAYADFEQLTGGMKKLYGEAADTVIADSRRAYNEVGISANQYMQGVAGFSAALKNSLGGDAQEAARLSNTAMKDIADNANTFGKYTVDELTQVYQALAKGQYQTLDNLNLGYGGTKEGMQQLIDKANELRAANGESADLTIDKFSDIVQAIHTVQDEMRITGTTQAEAMWTISGSINSAKAAWDNLLTSLAAGDPQMLQDSISGLLDSIFGVWNGETQKREGGVINNIIPIVQNVGNAILEQIPNIGEQVGLRLVRTIMQAMGYDAGEIDTVMADLTEKFENAKETITNVFTEISTAVSGFFSSFAGTVDTGYLSVLFDTLKETASNAWGFIQENILPHLPELGELFGNVANFVMDFANSFLNLFNAISPIIPAIVGAVAAVKGFMFIQTIIGFFTGLGGTIASISTIIGTFGGVLGTVAAALGGWPVLIAAVVGAVVAFIATNEDFRNKVKEVWDKVSEAVGNAVESIKTFVSDCATGITEGFQSALDFLSGALDFFGGIGDAINDFMFGNLDALSNVSSSMEGLSGTTSTAMADVESSIDKGSDSVKKFDKAKMGNKRATAAVSGNAVDGKAKDAVNKTDAAMKNLKGKDVETKAHGNAIDGSAKTKVDELRGSIDALSSKTITITTNRVENVTKTGGAWGGIRLHAAGGIRIADRWGEGEPLDIVGERGPEAIVPLTSRYGGDFARMMGKEAARYLGGGNTVNVYLNYYKDEDATTLVNDMANELRIQGLL